MKKTHILLSILVVLIVIVLPDIIYAASGPPNPPGGGGGNPGCWPPPCVPIDGGISFLIAAGIGLGVKKAYGSRKNRDDIA